MTEEIEEDGLDFINEAIKNQSVAQKRNFTQSSYLSALDEEEPLKRQKEEVVVVVESPPKRKEGKRVKFHNEIESIKFFKLTDLPTVKGLSNEQVVEVQKHTANVPSHMMYSELKKLDMKLDRQKFEDQKS